MKWGLYSRVAVSLGSVLCVAMLGLGYVLLQANMTQLSSSQLAQVKLTALSLRDDVRVALQQDDRAQLTAKLQQAISLVEPQTQLAYVVVMDAAGKEIGGSLEKGFIDVAYVGLIDQLHVRQIDYQHRPVREVAYPVVDSSTEPAKYLASIHVAHFKDNGFFPQSKRTTEIILTLIAIWATSMVVIFIALSRSIKPLSALTQGITTTSFDSPHRVIGEELRSRNDEVGVLACAFDAMIANLQKSYRELEQRESHYRQLVETANVIPWELDLNSRRITYVGPQITDILGYNVDDWCQEKFWLDHVYSEDVKIAEEFYRRVASGGNEREIEYRIMHANGQVVWVRDWVHKSSADPRSPVLQGFMFDVTERVNARMELQRYREHLENVVDERTAELLTVNQELQSFTHSLSQDLRVPLRVINGFSQAMLEDYADAVDEEGIKNLKRICHGTEEMGKMIDDILILSHVTRQDLYRRKINLSEIAENIILVLKDKNSDVAVECVIEKDIVAYADPELLTIVLEHLLKNAWKFSSTTESPRIQFSSQTVDGKVIYSVQDNGAGFDMQYVEKLFLPFRRLHNSEEFSGTGLGLATVKRIILRHGGEVWGEGEVGVGATLHFTLAKSSAEMMLSEKKFIDSQDDVA